jgi:DNA-binding transcriptional LysR family regulator
MDRLDAMRAFARVAECGSFTKAAQTLRLSRPTITQLVQQLESQLGVRLLHRTTRTVKLTADGAAYLERVVRLLADLEEADASVRGASSTPRGPLRVDVPAPLARRILIPALPSFRARYPDIQLVLGASDREVDLVADGVDCVIRGGEPAPSGLRMRRLGALPFGVHASSAYLERAGRPQHPRELEQRPHALVGFVRQRTGRPRPLELRRGKEVVLVEGRHDFVTDDGDAYLAAGVAGLGVITAPDYMTAAHAASGELIPLLEGWSAAPMPLVALSVPNRHANERLNVFVDWVASLVARGVTRPGTRPRRASRRSLQDG